MSEPFIAEIRIFGCNFAPRSWAFCNGQLLPIAQNTALFSLVGTTYGGDGRTTLGLPNLQGRAPMHPGNGPGLTNRRLGETGGTNTETLSAAQMPNHNHRASTTLAAANDDDPKPAAYMAGGPTAASKAYAPAGTTPDSTLLSLPSQGGNQAHNNLQPYLALNFCIALIGLYPSRS